MSTINSTASVNNNEKEAAATNTAHNSVEEVVNSAVGTSAIDTDGSKTLNKKLSSQLLDEVIDPKTGYTWSNPIR